MNRALREKLVLNIGAFITSVMAEGTKYAKIDDAIKSLNEFRIETETQICYLSNTITRFMQAVDQRLEDRGDPVRCIEEPSVNTSQNSNHQYRSIKIDASRFNGTNVFGWIFKIDNFFNYITLLMTRGL